MTEAKIDQYFSPLARNSKRQRPSTASDTAGEELMDANTKDEKVCDITHGQLMAGLSGLLDQKLSKLTTKDDLVNLSRQVKELAEENKMLKDDVVRLQLQERVICCGDRLWVNRAHLLEKDGSAVIAHLPQDVGVDYIMSRVSYLKGTGYTVHMDFPMEVCHKRSCLAAVRSEVERVAGRMRMPLAFDHLTINSIRAGSETTATTGSSKTGEKYEHGNDDCESRCGDGDEHWTSCDHHRGLRGLWRSCIQGAAEHEGKEYW
ncbi:hypothetical protein J6590_090085 [Homalodisca vitripennis]|nr:hypothetical protein J6590_090085 [Homalodisca vitripennis]